jgi:YidC/Oxa1 family membrane protein insertase
MPILAAGITYWQMNSMYKGQQVNEQMKTMNTILPFVILFTGRTLSAGVLIYWIVSSLFQLVQQSLTTKLTKKEA